MIIIDIFISRGGNEGSFEYHIVSKQLSRYADSPIV